MSYRGFNDCMAVRGAARHGRAMLGKARAEFSAVSLHGLTGGNTDRARLGSAGLCLAGQGKARGQ